MKTVKWQRLQYMPGTGIGENGTRVTGCEEHIALSHRAATEGAVLLKNVDNLLPLSCGARVAVFGKAQADYVKGGGGSGDVTTAYVRSLIDGLSAKEAEGKLTLFAPLSTFYLDYMKKQRAEGVLPGFAKEPELDPKLVMQAREFTDLAILTICRFSSEGFDRTGEEFDGDFYLSREETAIVEAVKSCFDKIIVVLNIGGMMDTLWFRDEPKIGAALYAGQGGMEGGLAIADLLCGDVSPSGHLTDTFAENFAAYPSSAHFADSEDYVEYEEDIYVGYRYFETIPGAKGKVCYPFGFGLTYTTFTLEELSGEERDGEIVLRASVQNTGSRSGRQVLQIYCGAPQGKLGKAAKVLVGFQKTKLLAPEESEMLEIVANPYLFASYDDVGAVQKSSYVLEKGTYSFFAGFNVTEVEKIPYEYMVESARIMERLSQKCAPVQLHRRMQSDGRYVPCALGEPVRTQDDLGLLPFEGQAPAEKTWEPEDSLWAEPSGPRLSEVAEGKLTLDEFMKTLTDEMKVHLLGGQPNRGPADTFGFGNLPRYGIPNAMTADGPAGVRFREDRGVQTTAFPVASLMASTWDPKLVEEVNACAASEAFENGIGTWLTPAINIHRTPLCGRNFEYYSEDPFLAGKMAAAAVRGIQSQGVSASVKHFACNNKETNRRESDSRLSERALREIYLKAFEICVKEAQPWTIMSSYNIINGVRASENRELLTDILRGEWGFQGFVTTDWYTHSEQWREIAAGNDVKMGRGMPEQTLMALKEGQLSGGDLDVSVRRVLEMLLKLD